MITEDRDLRTGTSVWSAYPKPNIPYDDISADIKTDILIIGAGVSGAMMAEALTGHGFDVVVVDKRKPLAGATSASTALLQFEIDIPLMRLIKKIGFVNAASAWRRSKLGLESLSAKVQDIGIDCGLTRQSTLYLSGNSLNPAQLKSEGRKRTEIGLPTSFLGKKHLRDTYGVNADGALISHDNLVCNPMQMAAGFLNEAIRKGAKVYAPAEVVGEERSGYLTREGFCIKSKHVVYTTGFEIPTDIHTRKHKIISTWALATSKIPHMPKNLPMMWEAAEPYIYARTTPDGRVVFGGEDEDFSDEEKRDALIPLKQKKLEKKLARLLPDLSWETEFMWAGSFGASTTGLPSIGRIPGKKNAYAVMAYGGNGITFSRIAAELVAADILGHKDPDAALFSFK